MIKRKDIYVRDPFILVHDGRYYLYGTKMRAPERSFEVYISTDLESWEGPQTVFAPYPGFWSSLDYWAPEVHEYRGAFYMFATLRSENRQRGTQIFKADSPLGPFAPVSDGPVTPREWSCLDGTFYLDENGKPWMVFCHEWIQIKDGTICAIRLSEDLSCAIEKPIVLFHGSDAKWCKIFDGNAVTDGPFMVRTKSGKLLMLWSSCCDTGYCTAIARSPFGSISGPWIQDDKPLFSMDGGHGMLFYSLEGKPYIALHAPNEKPLERPVWLEVTVTEDDIIMNR